MHNYKSVLEKAVEWNMSSRHVQYLCRNGKIEGAVKHAGVWFIPDNMCSPAKNSKPGAGAYAFVGTKKKIFNSAIELFMLKGFDTVSLKDIANKVGIRQSTIYNHFGSKQEILDAVYNFYCFYYLKDRPSWKDMEVALRDESFLDIIGHVIYDFKEDYIQKMSDITKIILQRIGIDDRAREIAKSLMVDEGVKFVEDVFNMGIENGRFAPFDTHSMSIFINSVRIFTLYNWIIDQSPDSMMKLAEDEKALYGYAARLIDDINHDRTRDSRKERRTTGKAGRRSEDN